MEGIQKSSVRSPITVSELFMGNYQKDGTITAMLRQTITTTSTYPGISVDSNLQQNVFSTGEFNATPQSYSNTEKRVAFIDVPTGTTLPVVQSKINADACLYKILSNQPILSDNHINAINRGLTTKDKIAESQAVRYPEGSVNPETGELNEGKLILDTHGRVQYRKVFFWNSKKEDVDLRGEGEEYLSPALKAEKEGELVNTVVEQPVITEQTIA